MTLIFVTVILVAGCNQIKAQKTPKLPDTSDIVEGIKIPPFACSNDEYCILVDATQPYLNKADYFKCGCPTCKTAVVDYSLDNYIAVNKGYFEIVYEGYQEFQYNDCKVLTCEVNCQTQIINDNFEARCIENVCTKFPR